MKPAATTSTTVENAIVLRITAERTRLRNRLRSASLFKTGCEGDATTGADGR